MQITHCRGQWCTPITSQRLIFALFVGNSLDGLFLHWHVECEFFPKTSWNVDSSDQRTRFHCLSVHLRWLPDPENSMHFSTKWINAFLFQVAVLDAAADCADCWWFPKVHLSPGGDVHHRSMTVLNNTAELTHNSHKVWHKVVNHNPSLLEKTWSWYPIPRLLSVKLRIMEPSGAVLFVTFSVLFCPNFFWVCCRRHILLFFYIYKIQLGLSVRTLGLDLPKPRNLYQEEEVDGGEVLNSGETHSSLVARDSSRRQPSAEAPAVAVAKQAGCRDRSCPGPTRRAVVKHAPPSVFRTPLEKINKRSLQVTDKRFNGKSSVWLERHYITMRFVSPGRGGSGWSLTII